MSKRKIMSAVNHNASAAKAVTDTLRESRESEIYDTIMDEANTEYWMLKALSDTPPAPGVMPQIQSDQVKAVVRVIARMLAGDAINGGTGAK